MNRLEGGTASVVKREIISIFAISVGSLFLALGVNCFVDIGGLYPSGFTGVTVLAQRVCFSFLGISIPFSLVYIPLNVIPAILARNYLGKRFLIYSFYSAILTSILTDALPNIDITDDILLIAIFGGIANGIGNTICLLVDGSTGGTSFISIYVSEKYGKDAWNYIFAGNVVVLLCAGLLFGIDKALYSIIYQFTATQIINTFFKKYQKAALWIITDMPESVYAKIKNITNHSATMFKGTGFYDGKEQNMVYSVVGRDQVNTVVKAITQVDERAFVNVTKVKEVQGNFYNKPN
ncbi:MAG: YitT family protein [Clostridia bacterium]|nr:YitT family protein [Clostridia bacterium]